jgi:hypothetical protein
MSAISNSVSPQALAAAVPHSPASQAIPTSRSLSRHVSAQSIIGDMPPTKLVTRESAEVAKTKPETPKPNTTNLIEDKAKARQTLAVVLCDKFPRAERCNGDVLETRIDKFSQWDLPENVHTVFCTRAPRCTMMPALDLSNEEDRIAAVATCAVDQRVSKFKVSVKMSACIWPGRYCA